MARLRLTPIIRQLRRQMGILQAPGESVSTSAQVIESATRNLSDEKLLKLSHEVETYLVGACKAQWLPGAIVDATVDPSSVSLSSVGRFLSVERAGVHCRPFTTQQHLQKEVDRMPATEAAPRYTIDTGALLVFPSAPSVRVRYVRAVPPEISLSAYGTGSDETTLDDMLALPFLLSLASLAEGVLAEEVPERASRAKNYRDLRDQFIKPFLLTWRSGLPDEYAAGRVEDPETDTE